MSTLDKERATASFDVKELSRTLYGDALEDRLKFEKLFSSNPIFDKSRDMDMSRDEYTKKCLERSFETYRIVKKNKDLLAKHSPLHGEGGFSVGSFGTPTGLTDHFALFISTLLSQATKEQQREWLMKAINLQIIGTYAQTELGHGSNVRGLETTATYDPDTDEFIINSPDVSAAKWWPGALGLLATHAIAYARLIIKGKDYGFHAFVVQIRDENHRPLPGIEVGDIGPKMGYNAYDSGYLLMKNIRIPRFNMLARFQQMEKGGEYKKAPPALAKIAYFTMLKIRVAISVGAGQALARCLTIAIRYNATRKQGFIQSKGGAEHPIINYTIQQSKLFPQLSTAFALTFASMDCRRLLDQFEESLKKGEKDSGVLPVLHATAAGLKAFSTELAVDGIEEARRCCGGQGYALASGIGMFQMTYLPSITFEGDYVPMALQLARFLVGCVKSLMAGKKLHGAVEYLARKSSGSLPSSVAAMRDPKNLIAVFEDAARRSVFSVAKSFQERLSKGVRFEEAWNAEHIGLMKAARNHTLCFILSSAYSAVSRLESPKVKDVILRLVSLFGLTRVRELGRFAQLTTSASGIIDQAVHQLLGEIRPDAVSLVDSFGFTDFQLNTCIGNYNNDDMYERLVAAARANPLNKPEYLQTFHNDLLAQFLNKEYLANNKAKL